MYLFEIILDGDSKYSTAIQHFFYNFPQLFVTIQIPTNVPVTLVRMAVPVLMASMAIPVLVPLDGLVHTVK